MKKISTVKIDYKENLKSSDNNYSNNKTTNINILLNRVRLDEKKVLRKKITFFCLLIGLLGVVSVYILN